MTSFSIVFRRDQSSSSISPDATTTNPPSSPSPSSTTTYSTSINGCLICPTTAPACPTCPSGTVCNLSLQSCNECPSVQCVPIQSQVLVYPTSSPSSSSSTAASTSTQSSEPSAVRSTSNFGPVVGGTAGGVLFLIFLAVIFYWCTRRRRTQRRRHTTHSAEENEKKPYPISAPRVDSVSTVPKEMVDNTFSVMHKSNRMDKTVLEKSRRQTRKNIDSHGVRAISHPRILSSTYREPTVALYKNNAARNSASNANVTNNLNELDEIQEKFQKQLQTTRNNYIKQNKSVNKEQSIRTSFSSDLYNRSSTRPSTHNKTPITPAHRPGPSYSSYGYSLANNPGTWPSTDSQTNTDTTDSYQNTRNMPNEVRGVSVASNSSVLDNSANVIPIAYIPGVTSRPAPNTYQPVYTNTSTSTNNINRHSNPILYSQYLSYQSNHTSSTASDSENSEFNTFYENNHYTNPPPQLHTQTRHGSNSNPNSNNSNPNSHARHSHYRHSKYATNNSSSMNRVSTTTHNGQVNNNFSMTVDSKNFDNVSDNTDDEYDSIQNDIRSYR